MIFNLQPLLENDRAILQPLSNNDFEALYEVASDPLIWEQHPNRDRYKRDVFLNYFEGAIQSKGAFKIIDKASGKLAGCTRFYEYNVDEDSIKIGYTFYATEFWGKGLNASVKELMLDHAFKFVSKVYFEIGAQNFRSQIAIERLGAKKIGEKQIAYYGEEEKMNFVYVMERN